jgi:hypothetical protein
VINKKHIISKDQKRVGEGIEAVFEPWKKNLKSLEFESPMP